jgi:uncharacterized membrane protein
LVVVCWLFVVGCLLLVVGCWLLVVGCWLLVVGCWLLVVGCWLLVVGCWLLVLYLNYKSTDESSNVSHEKTQRRRKMAASNVRCDICRLLSGCLWFEV